MAESRTGLGGGEKVNLDDSHRDFEPVPVRKEGHGGIEQRSGII